MGDEVADQDHSSSTGPATSSPPLGSSPSPLALAGMASLGAGAIHAAAIGVHSEHRQAVYAFTAVAVFQLGWGAVALVRSSRRLALIGAIGNAAIVGGWVLAKTTGISFVEGLTEAEAVQTADALAAGLAAAAVLVAAAVVASPRMQSSRLPLHGAVAALVVAAVTVPAMVSAGSHSHSGGHGDSAAHAHAGSDDAAHHDGAHDAAADEVADHPHGDDPGSGERTDEHATGDEHGAAAPGVLHDHGEVVAVTAAELDAAVRLVADTKVGTERFQDLDTAVADGYYQVAPPRNRLVHYMNTAYNRDGRILDPERPESLIYLNLTDGSWRLVGAMYRMPAPDQPGPRIGGPLTAWHAHNNLCRADGRVVGVSTDGTCANGDLSDTPEMLHVWLVDNPDGVFADDMEPDGLLEIVEG